MEKDFDWSTEKRTAVVEMVECGDFENLTSDKISKMADIAATYKWQGYQSGWTDAVSHLNEIQQTQAKKITRNPSDATRKISVEFRDNFRINCSLTEEDAKEAEEKIKEVLEEIGSRYTL